MGEAWPRDRWQAAIWADPMLKPNEKLVAHAFAYRAFQNETVWATYDDLKTMTGLARSSIAVARKGLETTGWLAQVKGAYYHQAPVFRLTYPLGRLLDASMESKGVSTTDTLASAARGPGDGPHGVRETDGWGPGAGPINSPKNSPNETQVLGSRERGPTTATEKDFNDAVVFIADYAGYSDDEAVQFVEKMRVELPNQRSLVAFLKALDKRGELDGFIGRFYAPSNT